MTDKPKFDDVEYRLDHRWIVAYHDKLPVLAIPQGLTMYPEIKSSFERHVRYIIKRKAESRRPQS